MAQLEAGTAPWQKPWAPGSLRLPYNPETGIRYKGSNSLWLEMQGRGDPRWLTSKRAEKMGAQVRYGESGAQVVFWKFREGVVQLDKPKVFSAVRFNAEQIEGLPALEAKEPSWDRHERAEVVLETSGIEIRHDQADRASYRPATDRIHLPGRDSFIAPIPITPPRYMNFRILPRSPLGARRAMPRGSGISA